MLVLELRNGDAVIVRVALVERQREAGGALLWAAVKQIRANERRIERSAHWSVVQKCVVPSLRTETVDVEDTGTRRVRSAHDPRAKVIRVAVVLYWYFARHPQKLQIVA